MKKKYDLTAFFEDGNTPLHLAAEHNLVDIVCLILNNGISANIPNYEKLSPLHIAAAYKSIYTAACLLEHNAELSIKDSSGYTPLHDACKSGCLGLVQLFVNHGADIYSENDSGHTPLYIASEEGHADIVKFFLNLDKDSKKFNLVDPAQAAAASDNLEIVKLFIDCNLDINTQGEEGFSLIKTAITYNAFNVVSFLIRLNKNSINTADLSECLFEKNNEDYLSLIKCLIKSGVNINIKDDQGNTPLHNAVENYSVQVVKLLVKIINVNDVNDNNQTPLHILVKKSKYSIDVISKIKVLIDAGTDVNIQDNNGYIPAYYALRNKECTSELLRWLLFKSDSLDLNVIYLDTRLNFIEQAKNQANLGVIAFNHRSLPQGEIRNRYVSQEVKRTTQILRLIEQYLHFKFNILKHTQYLKNKQQ